MNYCSLRMRLEVRLVQVLLRSEEIGYEKAE